jgi:hypothetical protein
MILTIQVLIPVTDDTDAAGVVAGLKAVFEAYNPSGIYCDLRDIRPLDVNGISADKSKLSLKVAEYEAKNVQEEVNGNEIKA